MNQDDVFQEVAIELAEVEAVMRDNIEKAVQRGDNLKDVEDKSNALQDSALRFRNTTVKLKRKMWCQDKIIIVIIFVIILALLLLIVIPIVSTR